VDVQLFPKGHPLYNVVVYDKAEQRVYNRSTDTYYSADDSILLMLEAVERFTVLESHTR